MHQMASHTHTYIMINNPIPWKRTYTWCGHGALEGRVCSLWAAMMSGAGHSGIRTSWCGWVRMEHLSLYAGDGSGRECLHISMSLIPAVYSSVCSPSVSNRCDHAWENAKIHSARLFPSVSAEVEQIHILRTRTSAGLIGRGEVLLEGALAKGHMQWDFLNGHLVTTF